MSLSAKTALADVFTPRYVSPQVMLYQWVPAHTPPLGAVMSENLPELSIVIPVFNEEQTLPLLMERIAKALGTYGRTFEVIAVDDGSRDRSFEILKDMRAQYPWLRIIRFMRNFGQNPALFAGFSHVRGRYVVMIDADLQNQPEDIPKLIDKIEEGYDVVSGWRQQRQDKFTRMLPSRILNVMVAYITGVHLHDYGCALKAFRREVADQLSTLTHRSRYVPVEMVALGLKFAEVKVGHNERAAGESKYGFMQLVRISFDLLTSITTTPIQMIGFMGWCFAGVGFLIAAWILAVFVVQGQYSQSSMIMALFLILTGVQMTATGFMCEYISRIFVEVQQKPYYIVKEIVE